MLSFLRAMCIIILDKISKIFLGVDVAMLSTGTSVLEKTRYIVKAIMSGRRRKHLRWLLENREERMDAAIGLFDAGRRSFHLARYEFAAKYVEGKTVADIACGTGYGSHILSKIGKALMVVGVDMNPEAVCYANSYYNSKCVRFVCESADSTSLPQDGFDVVVSFETLEHVANDKHVLEEFYRILKINGIFICSTPNEWPVEESKHHLRTYDKNSLVETLEKYFHVLELYSHNSGTSSPYNRGMPAGIVETIRANYRTAECFIAVCSKRQLP